MAKNQNTFEKRKREVEKKQKADAKRERKRRNKERAANPVDPTIQENVPDTEAEPE